MKKIKKMKTSRRRHLEKVRLELLKRLGMTREEALDAFRSGKLDGTIAEVFIKTIGLGP